MKGFITLSTILAGLVIALFTACHAHADNQSFLAAAHQLGYIDNDQATLRDGYAACTLVQESGDNQQLVDHAITAVLHYLGRNVTDEQSDAFVTAAITNLCPEVVTTR